MCDFLSFFPGMTEIQGEMKSVGTIGQVVHKPLQLQEPDILFLSNIYTDDSQKKNHLFSTRIYLSTMYQVMRLLEYHIWYQTFCIFYLPSASSSWHSTSKMQQRVWNEQLNTPKHCMHIMSAVHLILNENQYSHSGRTGLWYHVALFVIRLQFQGWSGCNILFFSIIVLGVSLGSYEML